jgi:hypothetical protein
MLIDYAGLRIVRYPMQPLQRRAPSFADTDMRTRSPDRRTLNSSD